MTGAALLTRETGFVIWSHMHTMWWGPHRQGYTLSLPHAGVYRELEAREIERESARGPASSRSEARPLAHQATDGTAPMRPGSVVWLATMGGAWP
jgi:hypothetical protein